MKHSHTIKIVYSSLFSALIFIGTWVLKIPLAFGYFNLGDAFILLGAYFIGGGYAVAAAALGSVLADIMSGYVVYAPATLVIKSAMVIVMLPLCRRGGVARFKYLRFAVAAALAEAVMVCGYFAYDSILYGISGAALSLAGNLLQAVASVAVSLVSAAIITRLRIFER